MGKGLTWMKVGSKMFFYITFTFLHVDTVGEAKNMKGIPKTSRPRKEAIRIENLLPCRDFCSEGVRFCCESGGL